MFQGLQVGRGIAALLVLLHHATLSGNQFYGGIGFNSFWKFGSIGVDFFFVLSGFIIYWVHSEDKPSTYNAKQYALKRLIRIYPPFIVISVIMLLAYTYLPNLSQGGREIGVLTSLFLIPTPPLSPALSVSWTLMFEMFFYIVFLILFISRTVLHTMLLIWGVIIVLTNVFLDGEGIIFKFFLHPHNLQFMAGIIAALLVKHGKQKVIFLIAGLTMLISYISLYNQNLLPELNVLVLRSYLGICFMFIVVGLCSVESYCKYPKFMLFLGSASYSIYLVHNPVISIANRVASKVHEKFSFSPEIFFVAISVLALMAGIFYYLIWERPSLNYCKVALSRFNRNVLKITPLAK